MILNGDLSVESSLFTQQETAFLNYMLNTQQFHNGPELRNKYVHGRFSTDTAEHERDYLEFLKIMTLLVLKINEEFCLVHPAENGEEVQLI